MKIINMIYILLESIKSTLDLNRAKFLGIKGVLATSIFIKQRIPKLYITKEKTNLKK